VRVSQISGTRPGALYPGVHAVVPLMEYAVYYDIREQMLETSAGDDPKATAPVLRVQTREGLPVGLALAVRFRLDPRRLDHLHANAVRPVEKELVPPVVASAFRQVAPGFTAREVFSTKREEIRRRAAEVIAAGLARDGILVQEVMLRDLVLPPDFAKGLEGILLKEQENERLTYELEIKQKMVRASELEAEAAKVRRVKGAEAEAQVKVLEAKGEADAMQHTLPLKQKQIEQTRLEAEAKAVAKLSDSKAELERRKLLADADAHRIRVTAAADSERMKLEAAALQQSPLLIQKILAEKLSDKVQVMMVPTDGRFLLNDLLRPAISGKQ
jgi:regulator of protease activity HflC (stomatin/prohibitin superfamily)